MKQVLLLFVALLSFTIINAQSTIAFEKGDLASVFAKAKTQDKLIFIDAYTTWCGPCKWMAKNVFTDESAAAYYNQQFINVKLDMEKGEGIDFGEKYKVNAYPTLLFLNAEGEVVHLALGSRSIGQFIQLGENALNPETQYLTQKQKHEAGERGAEFLRKYTEILAEAALEKQEVVNQYLKTQDDWNTAENMEYIFTHSGADVSNHLFKHMHENAELFRTQLGADKIDSKIEWAINRSLPDDASPKDLREAYKSYFPKTWEDKYTVSLLERMMNGSIDVSNAEFTRLADNYFTTKPQDSWSFSNSAAWYIFENSVIEEEVEKAIGWALQSISIESNAYNNDTAAWLYYKNDDLYNATAFAKRAIDLGIENGDDTSETEKLIEKIKAEK